MNTGAPDSMTASVTTEIAPNNSDPTTRRLKIEEDGDPWKGKLRPKIRLQGCWLERAGFKYGNHVSVKCVAAGVIELRFERTAPALDAQAL